MNLNDLNKVWEIKPLKKPREDEAREILEKVAKQVQPIMRKRKWKVNLLSEFCPPNPALLGLNINGGAEVKIRLRMQYNEWDFFPYEQILDTMLHELCHNEIGPHNSEFYKLLDEIRKECEGLMAKGITGSGQGFDLPGKRLGGFTRQPPLASLRQKALSAAENRAQKGSLMSHGPKRVGGDTTMRAALTPIQAAAMAAERRLHDDLWCGQTSVSEVGQTSETPVSVDTNHEETQLSKLAINNHKDEEAKTKQGSWECGTCTLLNEALAFACEACGNERIQEKKTRKKSWSCKFCTLENSIATERCKACGEWKYSYGAPSTSHTPYVGT